MTKTGDQSWQKPAIDNWTPQFSSLDQGKVPWRGYGIGFILQCLLMGLMIVLGIQVGAQRIFHPRSQTLLYPVIPPKAPKIRPMHMPRALRKLAEYTPPPRPKSMRINRPHIKRIHAPVLVKLPTPIKLPNVALPKPKPLLEKTNFHAVVAKSLRPKAPAHVRTGAFEGAPKANRHLLAARKVQTGGFGDPAGIRGRSHGAHGNVTALGSFGLPEGPGHGNGRGGRHGAAGAIARIGFGNGLGNGIASGPAGAVHKAGFSGQTESATARHRVTAPVAPRTRAVVILYKPHPSYTAIARAKRLQGSVWLSVIFLASGHVQVLHVIQGLGGGLDQSAIQAARAIRFQAALRNGKPVNFPARIRIRFRLAH